MTELLPLLSAIRYAAERNLSWCLATLYAVDGSAYRLPGARMAVVADGTRFGAVSGGCLEGEVAEVALRTIERGAPLTAVLNDDVDRGPDGFGTGCNGRLHLLFEPVCRGSGPLSDLVTLSERRIPLVRTLAVTPGAESARVWQRITPGDAPAAPDAAFPPDVVDRLRAEAENVLQRRVTQTAVVEHAFGTGYVLFEFLEPRIRLIVVGDGYDVVPVGRLASALGWETEVVGRRGVDDLHASFPDATHTRFAMHHEEVLKEVRVDEFTAVVIMSHGFERDRAALAQAIATRAFYIGVLGPARRTEQMGVRLDTRVHAPLGLDVGAETPAEIALALASEIQATLRRRAGRPLRDRPGPIHRPVQTGAVISAGERTSAN